MLDRDGWSDICGTKSLARDSPGLDSKLEALGASWLHLARAHQPKHTKTRKIFPQYKCPVWHTKQLDLDLSWWGLSKVQVGSQTNLSWVWQCWFNSWIFARFSRCNRWKSNWLKATSIAISALLCPVAQKKSALMLNPQKKCGFGIYCTKVLFEVFHKMLILKKNC